MVHALCTCTHVHTQIQALILHNAAERNDLKPTSCLNSSGRLKWILWRRVECKCITHLHHADLTKSIQYRGNALILYELNPRSVLLNNYVLLTLFTATSFRECTARTQHTYNAHTCSISCFDKSSSCINLPAMCCSCVQM